MSKPKGPFQCPFCKHEPFDTEEELDAHIKTQHPKAVGEAVKRILQEKQFRELRQGQESRRKAALLRLRRKRIAMSKVGV